MPGPHTRPWRHVADQLRPRWPKLAALIDESEHDILAHITFPAQHRTKLHSTNPLERLNKKVKRRRADVVSSPAIPAAYTAIGAKRHALSVRSPRGLVTGFVHGVLMHGRGIARPINDISAFMFRKYIAKNKKTANPATEDTGAYLANIFVIIDNESGLTAIEYGLIAALIAVAVVVKGTVGTNLSTVFSNVASSL